MKTADIAIAGLDAIGKMHADVITRRMGAARLAAVVEPSESARTYAESLGAAWFPDTDAMLAKMKPDGAIIATPNMTHLPLARQFMALGIPVLVEKPIAGTLEDAQALTAFSASTGVPALVGHHRRYNPIIRKAREIISGGRLGQLAAVSVVATFLKPKPYFDVEWRRTAGGGPILINLIHEIDLIRHLYGEIETVQAISSNRIRGFEVEDTAVAALKLASGALVTVTLSDAAAAPWNWDLSSGELPSYPPQPARATAHSIAGTEASLTLPHLEFWSYKSAKGWYEPISVEDTPHEKGSPYERQIDHFVGVIRGVETPIINAADATRTLRATLAAQEAAKSGRLVRLS
jgi:predicted dehydrogenase